MSVLEVVIFLLSISPIFSENCDHLGVLLYENLGCTPNFKLNKSCPVSYSCNDLQPCPEKNCRTRTFNSESRAKSAPSIGPGCSRLYSCSDSTPSELFVAIIDCRDRPDPECYSKYSLERCCSSGQVCPPFNANDQKCVVDGTTYREGERFFPENSCWKCVCQKGFSGKFQEPFCQRLGCGIDKSGRNIARICAPIFDQTNNGPICCPGDWLCPSSSDGPIQGPVSPGPKCRFGDNRNLFLGQKFRSKYQGLDVECECILPPLVSCKWVF